MINMYQLYLKPVHMLKYCRNIWFNQKEPTDQHLQCCVNVSLTAYHNWPGGGSLAEKLHEPALHHEPEASRHVEDDGEEDEVKWHPLVVGVIHDCVVTVVLKQHHSSVQSWWLALSTWTLLILVNYWWLVSDHLKSSSTWWGHFKQFLVSFIICSILKEV